jgi:S1-C subfamily serine protease
LLDENGSLVALGSLLVQTENENESERRAANLCVPLDVIEPLLGDLVSHGRRAGASRPWLGLYSTVQNEQVVVAGLLSTAPAHSAGVEPGDMVLEVGGRQIHTLPDFYRALWRQGDAGVTIPLTLQRGSRTLTLQVHSARREQFLKTPLHH